MLYKGALSVERFIAFRRQLAKDANQKMFVIVDNLKVHHAAIVKVWVAAQAREIELFQLPAYTPEHNPDEYLSSQRSPCRIQIYFKPSAVRYAA